MAACGSAPPMSSIPASRARTTRAAMRQNMSARLAGAWGEVAPRPMDFDGTTFRKPGGIAPQIEWNAKTRRMTLYVYIGTQPVLKIPLHPVGDFTDNPWSA